MKPRFAADYRLLVWTLVLLPAVPIIGLCNPVLGLALTPLALYLAYCTGIASHYHNHCPVFTSQRANKWYSAWLSIFYGYPIFAWIPTHNQNHHRYTNRVGDLTRTSRYAKRNSVWYALTYPFASMWYQMPAISAFVKAAHRQSRSRFITICGQYAALLVVHAAGLAAAIWLHGGWLGVGVYLICMGLPAGFAMWSMMFTNFIQHIDCDEMSANNHSRNFTGRAANWLVFNSGYHTVHHEHPTVHWSQYATLHEQRASAIAPQFNQPSLLAWLVRTYVLGDEPGLSSAATS